MASCPTSEVQESCSYECRRCNIVVLGQTGSGKSTVANAILRHPVFHVEPDITFRRVTYVVSCGERAIKANNIVYSVKVVDTIGFSDPQTSNEVTLKKIKTFFQTKVVEGVSLVLFVMKPEPPSEDIAKMIKIIMKNFHGISPMSALILTHLEDLDDNGRKHRVREFSSNESTSYIAEFAQKGIFTVGFPHVAAMDEGMAQVYDESMEEDVKKLHTLIYDSIKMRLTSDMFFDDKFWKKVQETQESSSGPASNKCDIM